MLRLDQIKKDYLMKDNVVHAIKGLSICFRKSEFVSILGPSGCGKTTLLNIIGGLDHATSGDLLINGKSTKNFKDHDWDIYRNHSIGFIFQSYNLIPHQNILSNVELSLTIGGVSKEERTRRAKQALDRVGLQGLYNKKPNQLSGGQCQRVAIARALVNEPEILLADEPTGALDSETSVQIMDLIKEISKDKLVIMVTHNPDLAMKYSTRIVKLLDGELLEDSAPYSIEEEENERKVIPVQESVNHELLTSGLEEKVEKKEFAKMSWWTAFKLSAKNLVSKMKRTVMTVIASSVGIVGVSAVLSVSYGVNGYIESIQDELLSGNPVYVATQSMDLSSLMNSMGVQEQAQAVKESVEDGYVNVDFLTETLIKRAKEAGSAMISNDITKDYEAFIDNMPDSFYQDIVKSYSINITNNIYTEDDITGQTKSAFSLSAIRSFATSILEKKLSQAGYSAYSSLVSSYGSTFSQSLNNADYLLSQYDVVKGSVAQKEDEMMIVLSSNQELQDFQLTLLGYYGQEDFLNIVRRFNDEEYDKDAFEEKRRFTLDSLMNKRFTYYPNDTVFTKVEDPMESMTRPYYYSYYEDSSWNSGFNFKITGILKPKKDRQYSSLEPGFYYTPAFAKRFIKDNLKSSISTYISDFIAAQKEEGNEVDGYSSYILTTMGTTQAMGIYYQYDYELEGTTYPGNYALVGSSNSLSSILSSFIGSSSGNSMSTANLSLNAVGGSDHPTRITIYPNDFKNKYLVTDYLDKWNSKEDIVLPDRTVKAEERDKVTYNDNLEVIISIIKTMIDIVTIALIAFTALSLVVSTVMIAIIIYVSVMERIKEIGVIRAMGGRKKDVSRLFNAEAWMLGLFSGVFGIAITYVIQTVLNFIIGLNFANIGMIANLPILAALIVILISILLTAIAGIIPAASAARKDPVVALRTE